VHTLFLYWTILLFAQTPQLPTELPQVRFNSGQDVVPYFEGWIRNPDGTFDLVFGYFNRNWKEELTIPPGPDNSVEPGGPDVGQPTYFLPRRQRWLYRLRVPADFGNKEVTWTLTAHGRTEKAYGNLLAAEEITDRVVSSNGNFNPGQDDPNEPPSIKLAPIQNATVSAPLTLAASVVDDGLPKPRPVRTSRAPTSGFGAQVNSSNTGAPRGLTLRWLQYGGPAKVSFDSSGPIPVTNGQATTAAHFSQPGIYHLRAVASDGALSTTTDIVITVK
jgi:hypothetical protein